MRRTPSISVSGGRALGGSECFIKGLEYALSSGGEGAGEASACGEHVAAAAEVGADAADVELRGFGAEAEADFAFWAGEFLEGGGDDDAFDGAEVVDEAFGVFGECAGGGHDVAGHGP